MKLEPGEVVLIDYFAARDGKPRPAIVVSSETYHRTRPDFVAALCTTNLRSATAPSDCVLIDWQAAGLTRPTAVRMWLVTREQSTILQKIGKLTDPDWKEVQARMRVALEAC